MAASGGRPLRLRNMPFKGQQLFFISELDSLLIYAHFYFYTTEYKINQMLKPTGLCLKLR